MICSQNNKKITEQGFLLNINDIFKNENYNRVKAIKKNDVYTDENRKRILSDPRFKSALEQLKDNTEKVSNSVLLREDFSLFRMFMENGSRKEFQAAYWAPRKNLPFMLCLLGFMVKVRILMKF